ncbi:MAG: ABC transporter substrate-binding protein [Desulfobacteraceae bacterium]|nr:ABC transporter substrate-binding protein [Desulfobacteraceae bacterium]
MKKAALHALILCILVSVLAFGPSTPAAEGYDPDATVKIGSMTPPVSLNNVGGAGQGVNEALYCNVYEPLMVLEDDGAITNGLAASYEISGDGLVYTFKLRKGVTFHDGSPLMAADVKFSFNRVLTKASKAARKADLLRVIDKVDVVDDGTIVVKMKQKSQSMMYFVTYVWILKEGAANTEATANGTGPFKLADYKSGTSITLERNAHYWGDAARCKKIIIKYFNNNSAQANALTSGQIDIITNVDSPEQLTNFKGKSKFTITEGKSTVKQVLAFNDQRKPFTDMRVRQAISSAINKEAIRKATWDTYGLLIGSFVPPSDPWYEDLSGINSYNPARAGKLLADAGLPDGFSFELITPATEAHQLSAQAVKNDLAKIGVTVSIKVIDPSAWYQIVFKNRDYDATLQEHVNDRDLVWYGNPKFYWGYDNKDVQQWVSDAQLADTPEQETAIYKKIARTIAEEAASSWLYLYPQLRISASNVTGYPANGKNASFYMGKIRKK